VAQQAAPFVSRVPDELSQQEAACPGFLLLSTADRIALIFMMPPVS
jgi:hypothetical protein